MKANAVPPTAPSRRGVVLMGLAGGVLFVGLAVLAWGDWRDFFSHPARAAAVAIVVVATVAGLCSEANLSPGRREDAGNRWVMHASAFGSIVLATVPPLLEARGVWIVDGNLVRVIGVLLVGVGGVLRVWPMFVLGRRFSGLVAIQEGHRLATGSIYRVVRNPSYLGMMTFFVGWGLVFRSLSGLVLAVLGLPALVARIHAEERLLESEFGDEYVAYRRRTWRLVPGVY